MYDWVLSAERRIEVERERETVSVSVTGHACLEI